MISNPGVLMKLHEVYLKNFLNDFWFLSESLSNESDFELSKLFKFGVEIALGPLGGARRNPATSELNDRWWEWLERIKITT